MPPRRAQTERRGDWRARILLVLLAAQLLLCFTPGLYRSTDFEVHRNWLAITSSLPLDQWYRDATSPNATLDYPPLFAWFEKGLAAAARAVLGERAAAEAGGFLRLQAEPHESRACVLFQRLTVVATGLSLAAVAWWASGGGGAVGAPKRGNANSGSSSSPPPNDALLFFLITCNAGLLMVDNVHFQYNGWLLALLLASVLLVERGGEAAAAAARGARAGPRGGAAQQTSLLPPVLYYVLASAAFSALLNAKHLFAYAGPAFFVYLLRGYVLAPQPTTAAKPTTTKTAQAAAAAPAAATSLARLAAVGAPVVAVFAASLGPFYAAGALPDIAARLFPFGRGLLHAYWAPNAWALYAALDKALSAAAAAAARIPPAPLLLPLSATSLGKAGGGIISSATTKRAGSMSDGVVGVAEFAALPQVGPRLAAAATLAAMAPALAALWRRPDPRRFAGVVAHGLLCGFMFGYHVHEKAALTFLLPMALLAARPGEGHNGLGGGSASGGSSSTNSSSSNATAKRSRRDPKQEQQEQQQQRQADRDAAVDFLLASTAGHVGPTTPGPTPPSSCPRPKQLFLAA